MKDKALAITNICQVCGNEYRVQPGNEAAWWSRLVGLYGSRWRITHYSAEVGSAFGLVGWFLESNCPACGDRVYTRLQRPIWKRKEVA